MKICVLPIDSRPCSYDFVKELASMSGLECILPPIDIMDSFRTPSCFSVISKWLGTVVCDVLIISVDQLLYGSLLASRQGELALSTVLERLQMLETLKSNNPNLRIFASTVLMRTSISTLSIETKKWWEAVGHYSKYAHLVQLDDSDIDSLFKLNELKAKIPEAVLDEFLSVRKRNHEVNKKCIALAGSGVIEFLLILQEDCTEFGVHRVEQETLFELIGKYGIQHKAVLHNGTDEAVTELFARAAVDYATAAKIRWFGQNEGFIALFEDRPFRQNLMSHLRVVNIREDDEADIILFVYPPKADQGDFMDGAEVPSSGYSTEEMDSFAGEIADAVNQGKKCFLLDVAFANGGDLGFLRRLALRIDIGKLNGYSGWNTASNALGTVLSQIVLSGGNNNCQNKNFTFGRILDDVIYQGVVRKRLNDELMRLGLDPWHISDEKQADEILQKEFKAVWPIIDEIIQGQQLIFSASLRWPRTFEVDIRLEVPPK